MADAPDTTPLPAGEFSAWLRTMLAALAGDAVADTPCGECCACCATSHFVAVGPGDRETLANVAPELRFPAPGLPAGHFVLPFDEAGRCALLGRRGRCTIYAARPATCRVYDCRIFAAAGIAADRDAISRQAARWTFSYADARAEAEHAAVRAAARFVRGHAAAFPSGEGPEEPAELAVVAVKAASVFLAGGAGDPASPAPPTEVAAAVVAAVRASPNALPATAWTEAGGEEAGGEEEAG